MTLSFITLAFLAALIPAFQGAPIQRRFLHPDNVNANAGMLPRSDAQIERRGLYVQQPLNDQLAPRRIYKRDLDDDEGEHLHRRHLYVRQPMNSLIGPRDDDDDRLSRRHLYAQQPLNSYLAPRTLERRHADGAEGAQVPLGSDGPHHGGSIHFSVRPLPPFMNWRPRILPFQSIPSWSYSQPEKPERPGEPESNPRPVKPEHGPEPHDGEDQYALKKSEAIDDRSLHKPEMKWKSWGSSVSWHSEESIADGKRKANAQELIQVHSAHSPDAVEAKENGGKPVQSGAAVLITAKTPNNNKADGSAEPGAQESGSGKPEVTVDVAILGSKKHVSPDKADSATEDIGKSSSAPPKGGAEDGSDATTTTPPAEPAEPADAGAGEEGDALPEEEPAPVRRWFDGLWARSWGEELF